MQTYVVAHTGVPVPASTPIFHGAGVMGRSLISSSVESHSTLAVPIGDSSMVWLARAQNISASSRIAHMISSSGSFGIPEEQCHVLFFTCELPKGTDPLTITHADFLANVQDVRCAAVHTSGSYRTISWRDCTPMMMHNTRAATHDVYYGVAMVFTGLEAASNMDGYISVREVVFETPVLQPLK